MLYSARLIGQLSFVGISKELRALLHTHNSSLAFSSRKMTHSSPIDFDITAKVQLHIHLDGAVRLESALDMAKSRGIKLPVIDIDQLNEKVIMKHPETLTTFLSRFAYFIPAFAGDLDCIRRVARETAEDLANDNVIYCELRYAPHLLVGDSQLTVDEIVSAVCEELAGAQTRLHIKLRTILCCIRALPQNSLDVVRLCEKFKDQGVVAIDIAGDENSVTPSTPTQPEHFEAFRLAKEKGIHRTAHAGENGSYELVVEALDRLFAQRLGHGYHSVDDAATYQRVIRDQIHCECCLYSSIMTSAAPPDWLKHPCIKFARDGVNFSLNTDDPTITNTRLSDEYVYAENRMKLLKPRLLQCIFDGAHSAFLPDAEKDELVKKLRDVYKNVPGVDKF